MNNALLWFATTCALILGLVAAKAGERSREASRGQMMINQAFLENMKLDNENDSITHQRLVLLEEKCRTSK